MQWISVKNNLPSLSYVESDDGDDPYECLPVLVFSSEKPGICCVAYLEMNQDEDDWNFQELTWKVYVPGDNMTIEDIKFEKFTHWMPLPEPPEIRLKNDNI